MKKALTVGLMGFIVWSAAECVIAFANVAAHIVEELKYRKERKEDFYANEVCKRTYEIVDITDLQEP